MTKTYYTRAAFNSALALIFLSQSVISLAQSSTLTVEKIMQDAKWIGTSPSAPYFSGDSKYLFFKWNPDKNLDDSLYYITREDHHPQRAPYALQRMVLSADSLTYNASRTAYTFTRDGDIFYTDMKSGRQHQITRTAERETSPTFSFRDSRIVYNKGGNLYAWDIAAGTTEQLTSFQRTLPPPEEKTSLTPQDKWLQADQLRQFDVIKTKKTKKDAIDAINKAREQKALKNIYIDDKTLTSLVISPDGRFINYRLAKRAADTRSTIVPSYVTETGYTRDISGRSKVGVPQTTYTSFIFDTQNDTVITIGTDQIPGITDLPDYVRDYPDTSRSSKKS